MRIIAGQAKGHRLIAPPGINTRPTSDRVREALFSVIMPRLDRAKVLDAFAGSGALGLEALSRGAETVHFIEKDAKALKVLRRNVETCHLSGAEIFFGDTLRFLRYKNRIRYDIIFLDPPYHSALLARALAVVLMSGALVAGGLIVAETAVKVEFCLPIGLKISKYSVYGDTAIYYLETVGIEDKICSGNNGRGEKDGITQDFAGYGAACD